MSQVNWVGIRIHRGLKEQVAKFVKSKEAYDLGISNSSAFFGIAVRSYLEKCMVNAAQKDMVNKFIPDSSEHEPIR